jgi:hypothetical protein
MKTTLLLGALLTALPVAAATQPEFQPLAGGKNAATAKNGPVMRSPLAQTIATPLVSETQAIPTADGGLEIKCREVPNPRLRDVDDRNLPGPQR